MSDDLKRRLEASLEDVADDAGFVAEVTRRIAARPLIVVDDQEGVLLAGEDAARLARLAGEALRARVRAEPALQIGAKGRLVALIDRDDRARLIAEIEFDSECELRRAGQFIAGDVMIEPALDAPLPANESNPGHGVATEDTPP